uniref:Terminase ATPase subunit n=1 Tax=Photorhabdus luminescens TaxID=29488 RepID=B6SEE4_PHOLU|nr:terminase ATPase subunit [Photorhabdus luminescens]
MLQSMGWLWFSPSGCVFCFYGSSVNLNNISMVGSVTGNRFIKQGVHGGPCQICVTGFLAAAGLIGRAVAAGGGRTADSHKTLCNVGLAGVKLQPTMVDNVPCLKYQRVFNGGVIDKFPHGREKFFDVLVNPMPDAGRVNADIFDVVLFRQSLDGVRLSAKVHATPLMTFKDAEFVTRYSRWSDYDTTGTVAILATFGGIITDPDRVITIGA